MGLRTIIGSECGVDDLDKVVWYCSASGWALGPVFQTAEQADAFEAFVWREAQCDPRKVETRQLHKLWRAYLEVKRDVVAELLAEQS